MPYGAGIILLLGAHFDRRGDRESPALIFFAWLEFASWL